MNFWIRPLAAILCLMIAPWAQAQNPDPQKLISDSMAYIAGLNAVSVDVVMAMHADLESSTRDSQAKCALVMRGKQDLYLRIENEQSAAEIYAGGSKQTIHLVSEKEYRNESPPRPRVQLISMMLGGAMGIGSGFMAQYLHASDAVFQDVTEKIYVGQETIEGEGAATKYDHVQLKSSHVDLDLWLAPAPAPFLRRFRMDLAKTLALQPQGQRPKALIVTFDFAHWQPNPAVDDSRFVFVPPPGVKPMESNQRKPETEPLLGKPAANLTLDLLSGGKMDLSQHKGKQVVILDFWATWCGPCRMALPVLADVAKEYESKGVVFYAINQGETPERIKAFLEQSKLAVTVALDPDNTAGNAYRVSGIPRMLIIDKEGIVRAGHSGYSPTLKEDLKAELDAALKTTADNKPAQ